MAIDTAEKRKSSACYCMYFNPGVTPNALKDAEWRRQVSYGYSGIEAGISIDRHRRRRNIFAAAHRRVY
jgi:hypothetical protein